ncbi:tripartite tricarboxylate transporter TctB family protein [Falsiroseomonas tokyonensis]|uniref:Tripartite tricarboxylate transporter TctB family protein n=1 Tax=Falsiroseomonas tokyonensis TaxID=430521 RepID=A0ABV7BRQ6_9PROT|nr:tripartite tricarboxylate transporter TctB family protein [Falsiroseomonas tokyonensis]MBU8537220.1 tripartite tricarboxylate transporter TctB family protein [Falsiroseomonas tokyonensis]
MNASTARRGLHSGPDLAAALFVLGVGLLSLWQTVIIPTSPIYAQVGPKVVPYLVSACLVGLGIGLTTVAIRGGWSQDIEELQDAAPLNPRALGLLLAGLLANLVLIEPLGFTIAATAQFVLVAAAFGSRAFLRNLVIAFIVALSAYGLFVKGLGVNIGAGVVETLVFGDPG